MKAIHGGKATNGKVDALKIATLLRGRCSPRPTSTRPRCGRPGTPCEDASISSATGRTCWPTFRTLITSTNLDAPAAKIAYKAKGEGVAEAFTDPDVRESVEIDLTLIEQYDAILRTLELLLERRPK